MYQFSSFYDSYILSKNQNPCVSVFLSKPTFLNPKPKQDAFAIPASKQNWQGSSRESKAQYKIKIKPL